MQSSTLLLFISVIVLVFIMAYGSLSQQDKQPEQKCVDGVCKQPQEPNCTDGVCKLEPEPRPVRINPQISKIMPEVYISNSSAARDYESLKALGVTQILTVGVELHRHGEPYFKTRHIPIADEPSVNVRKHFNACYEFMKHGRTLVHCAAGISRSVTIVIAYLMRKYNWSLEKALAHVKKCRPIANPNHGFIEQLQTFATDIKAGEEQDA